MGIYSRLKNGTKLIRKRSRHRAGIFLKYLLARRPKDPLFVLATHRSGSNLLLSYLNSVPGISVANEILHPTMFYGIRRRAISKRAVLRHIAHSINNCTYRQCGAKMILDRMRHHGIRAEDLLRIFPTARFVVLYRRSLLDQYVSLKLAESTGVWHAEEAQASSVSFPVSSEELGSYCAHIRGLYAEFFPRPGMRSVAIAYEDLAADPQGVFEKTLFPFLGLKPFKVATPLKRQNSKKPREIVSNFDEIRALAERAAQEYFAAEESAA